MDCICPCLRARRIRREMRLGQVDSIVAESYAAGKLTPEGEVFLKKKPHLKVKANELLVARHNAISTGKALEMYVFVFETRLEQLEREACAMESKDFCAAQAKTMEAVADELGLHLVARELMLLDREDQVRKLHALWKRVARCREHLEGTVKMGNKKKKRVVHLEREFEAIIRAGV